MKNFHDHLRLLANKSPERVALLECDVRGVVQKEITRAALLNQVEECATHLANLGLRAGDTVALDMEASTHLLIISWAAWSTGIITVPLDLKRDTPEIRVFKLKVGGVIRTLHKEEWSGLAGAVSWMPDLSHETLILFTSGTTAHPKGARLTLQNLITNAEGIIDWLQIQEDDCFLVELPLHHINSTTFCLASLIAGASIAIPPSYSNSHFFEQAANSGATLTSVVPSIIFDQLSRTKEFEAVRGRLQLNRIQLGSAPVVALDAIEFTEKFSIPLYQGYGQTETALRVTGVPMDLKPNQYTEVVAENSIGTPMPWAQVEIADPLGRILGEGQEGEIVVKGPAVMQGYVGGESAFRDGNFLTGDIGYWKEIGGKRFFFLKGRSKEIIIKGGVNVSPVAVENALKRVSADVEQAYVVGVPDTRYGEDVGAAIVWKEGIDTLQAFRRLKLILLTGHEALSAYETPKYFATMHAEELPMTSTGKVQRTILRKTLEGTMESVYELMQSAEYRFVVIATQSPFAEASHALHNHCWQPLVKNNVEYKAFLVQYVTLGAIDKNGVLAGQVAFSYIGTEIRCVSICSAAFKPKAIPKVKKTPDVETVRQYLREGHDAVMNFHTRLGAELVEVIPQGRPQDRSSLGYTMLLRYPSAPDPQEQSGPVASQLIQAVRTLARDVGAEVTAVSRPGGLAAYLARER